jgi:hypothetical protein
MARPCRAISRSVGTGSARLVVLPGVGHDLPAPLWPDIAREVRQLADQPDQADQADQAASTA